jgi:hypothetical protein
MKGRSLISGWFGIFLTLLVWTCSSKPNQDQIFKLQSVWEYDSISGDSVLLPLNKEFDDMVRSYLDSVHQGQIPKFMYDIYLDSSYHRYKVDGTHGRSLRAAIISQIEDRKLLELMLSDTTLNNVWNAAKHDSLVLRTNIEMVRDKLRILDRMGNSPGKL